MPPKARRGGKKGPPPKAAPSNKCEENADDEEVIEKFALELRWCLQQIELSLEKKKGNAKQSDDLLKTHTTLASSKTPVIKKRQIMRTMFGDYRKKMEDEEKKLKIEKPKINPKISIPPESKYVRKALPGSGNDPKEGNVNEAINKAEEEETEKTEVPPSDAAKPQGDPQVSSGISKMFKSQTCGNEFRFNFSVQE